MSEAVNKLAELLGPRHTSHHSEYVRGASEAVATLHPDGDTELAERADKLRRDAITEAGKRADEDEAKRKQAEADLDERTRDRKDDDADAPKPAVRKGAVAASDDSSK